jgi:hypothetical protein
MAKIMTSKVQAVKDYIDTLSLQFPGIHAERMKSSSGTGDYWVRVEVPELLLFDVLDATSALSYDWHVKRGVDILASVTAKEVTAD